MDSKSPFQLIVLYIVFLPFFLDRRLPKVDREPVEDLREKASSSAGRLQFILQEKRQQSPDSWLLRFALPARYSWLGADPNIPTCIKVLHPQGKSEDGTPQALEKSYSPV